MSPGRGWCGGSFLPSILVLLALASDLAGQQPDPRFEQLRAHLAAVDAERWPEEGVLGEVGPLLRELLRLAERGEWPGPSGPGVALAASFRGSPAPTFMAGDAVGPSGYRHASLAPGDGSVLDAGAWAASWRRYLGELGPLERSEYHVSRVVLDEGRPAGGVRLTVDVRLTAAATAGSTLVREDQLEIEAAFVRGGDPAGWNLDRWSCRRGESVRGPRLFTDLSATLPLRPRPAGGDGATVAVAYFAEGITLHDLDRDGDLDLFVPRRDGPAEVLLNDGSGRFEAAGAGFAGLALEGVRCGTFFDWDNDGDGDALVVTRRRLWLMENRDGAFVDVSAASGFDGMETDGLTGVAVADYDGDGALDFYVVNYGNPDRGPGYGYFDSRHGFFNKLFRNEGGGRFADRTRSAGLERDNRRWSYAAAWIDHDGDSRPDLYVVNDYGPNQLFENRDGVFVDVAAEAGARDPGNGMGVSWADLDGDGRFDLYVSNMHSYAGLRITRAPGYRAEGRALAERFARGNSFLRGAGEGRFVEQPDSPLRLARWAWGQAVFDADNDGRLDVYVANGMFTNREAEDL